MQQLINSPIGGPLLVWTFAVQLVLYGSGTYADDGTKNCKLTSESESERKVLARLEALTHRNFTAELKTDQESYTYIFQLCGDAGGIPGAGVIQVEKKEGTQQTVTLVGSYNATQAIGGTDWVILTYGNGDKYDTHCSQELRRALIKIKCNRNVDMGQLEVILEDRDRKKECFYLFELQSSAVCPPLKSHLSAGSIILIIGVCLIAVYLIGGFLYQRLIVGAKGMEQFPNYAFWSDFGNLTADGCDFVCRSRSREEAPAYRGVATEPSEEEPEERDDHLLPM